MSYTKLAFKRFLLSYMLNNIIDNIRSKIDCKQPIRVLKLGSSTNPKFSQLKEFYSDGTNFSQSVKQDIRHTN